MNIHKHARMTSRGRLLLVQRIRLQGWRVAEAAAASGVSVRTAYKWLARHRTRGEPALHDRRSTPGRSPRRTPAEIVGAIDRLRRQRLSGPRIARRLKDRTRSRTARSIGSNQLSKRCSSVAASGCNRVVQMLSLIMAWSPAWRFNAKRFEVHHPGDYATLNSNQPATGPHRRRSFDLPRTALRRSRDQVRRPTPSHRFLYHPGVVRRRRATVPPARRPMRLPRSSMTPVVSEKPCAPAGCDEPYRSPLRSMPESGGVRIRKA